MRRRTFLRTTGLASAAALAGCLGGDGPEAANEYGYETTSSDGVDVPLVPIEDAVEWHRDDETLFVDARDRTAFERARIYGAVFSPAPDGRESGDPLGQYADETRIVTYCVCPHHLASLRAASLIRDGYVHTYALDEGLEPWIEAGHPAEGDAVENRPPVYEIAGRTDAAHAGELAWARHDPSGQREAVPIADDGAFTLHLRFHDLDGDSPISLETPAGETTRPLEALLDGVVEL